jgi:RNA polymerase Rpb2, domain 4
MDFPTRNRNDWSITCAVCVVKGQGLAGEFVSFYLHKEQRAVHIATDGGRVCRPLIIVDEATGLPKLKQFHIMESLALGVMNVRNLLRQAGHCGIICGLS